MLERSRASFWIARSEVLLGRCTSFLHCLPEGSRRQRDEKSESCGCRAIHWAILSGIGTGNSRKRGSERLFIMSIPVEISEASSSMRIHFHPSSGRLSISGYCCGLVDEVSYAQTEIQYAEFSRLVVVKSELESFEGNRPIEDMNGLKERNGNFEFFA